jgi:GntR family transcriptional repressor for pyruvate dehydrogenase complex
LEISKITNRKTYEIIAEQLQEQILSGKLQPGEKLPSTKELAERFQVGRSTMREALSALKAMGLINIYQGEGCFVRSIDPDSIPIPEFNALLMSRETILELMEARKALEIANASIAAEKRTEEDLAAFAEVLDQMEKHLGDDEAGEQADIRFHMILAESTHNSIMVRLLESISSQMQLAIRETRRLQMFANKRVSRQLWQEHHAIFDAVRRRDSAAAQECMRTHLHHVERVLIRFLRA